MPVPDLTDLREAIQSMEQARPSRCAQCKARVDAEELHHGYCSPECARLSKIDDAADSRMERDRDDEMNGLEVP